MFLCFQTETGCSATYAQNQLTHSVVNQVTPTCTAVTSLSQDPLETKGLDELIRFINGTEEDDKKPASAKAAKRARQKQRKVPCLR